MEMVTLWQELDSSSNENYVYKEDTIQYTTKLESKRLFKFLSKLNRELDEVGWRILSLRTLPSTREVFSEVHREDK